MPALKLTVLSLRYSSWSMRPWLALTHAGARFETETVELPHMAGASAPGRPSETTLAERRARGSVRGLFPVLRVDGVPIHESLAICEYAADAYPAAGLWPDDPVRRAQARAVSCEMATGFMGLRSQMFCHLFGRVPGFSPGADAQRDTARVFEIWDECLQRSGGPFLFGRFGIADAMYFPVLTRFRTYGAALPHALEPYGAALERQPAVRALIETARTAPKLGSYDEALQRLGGDPDAALRAG